MLVTPGSELRPCRANAGYGMPHLAITSSRSPRLLRMMGAILLGNTPGNGGWLPVMSLMVFASARMDVWLDVIE